MPCGKFSWSYIGETGRSFAQGKNDVKTAAECSESLIMLSLVSLMTMMNALTIDKLGDYSALKSFWNTGT